MCKSIFDLLERHLFQTPGEGREGCAADGSDGEGINPAAGRPGMDLCTILVLGLLKQGLNCDCDRLHELAMKHVDVRRMPGLSDDFGERAFSQRTVVRNVSLLTPDLLAEVNRLVVDAGHELVGANAAEGLRARCDSFVVETDVHYPTDVSLLRDALRRIVVLAAGLCLAAGVPGWRKRKYWLTTLKRLFNRVRSSRQRKKSAQRVKRYLEAAGRIVRRAEEAVRRLQELGAEAGKVQDLVQFVEVARKLMDQIERRVLQGERIPHAEKMFSIFEGHTRWCCKGKAGCKAGLEWPWRGASINSC